MGVRLGSLIWDRLPAIRFLQGVDHLLNLLQYYTYKFLLMHKKTNCLSETIYDHQNHQSSICTSWQGRFVINDRISFGFVTAGSVSSFVRRERKLGSRSFGGIRSWISFKWAGTPGWIKFLSLGSLVCGAFISGTIGATGMTGIIGTTGTMGATCLGVTWIICFAGIAYHAVRLAIGFTDLFKTGLIGRFWAGLIGLLIGLTRLPTLYE